MFIFAQWVIHHVRGLSNGSEPTRFDVPEAELSLGERARVPGPHPAEMPWFFGDSTLPLTMTDPCRMTVSQ